MQEKPIILIIEEFSRVLIENEGPEFRRHNAERRWTSYSNRSRIKQHYARSTENILFSKMKLEVVRAFLLEN